jgi:hypothetical protein
LHLQFRDDGDPVPLQRDLVASWRRIVRYTREGKHAAAVAIDREQSRFMRDAFRTWLGRHTVIDLYQPDETTEDWK